MINKFNLETVADPENMNMLIEGINKNEEDITAVKESVEEVGSAIGQIIDKEMYPVKVIADLNLKIDSDRFSCKLPLPLNSPTTNAFYCDTVVWKDNSSFIEQTVKEIAFGRIFRRVKNTTGWQPWIEVATTDKVIPYNPTPQPNLDANNVLTTSIITTASYCTNIPTPAGLPASTEGFLTTTKYNAQFIIQSFRSIYPEQPTASRTLYQGSWTPWSVGKQEIPFPFLSGFTNYSSAKSYITNTISSKKACICINCSGTFGAGVMTKIGVIPIGLRPTSVITGYIRGYLGATPIIQGILETDVSGNVYVTCVSAAIACFGTVEWDY